MTDKEFQELLIPQMPRLWKYAMFVTSNHHYAEEVLQEALLRAYVSRKTLRTQNFYSWIKAIIRNIVIDNRRVKHLAEPCFDGERSMAFDPQRIAEKNEMLREAYAAMEKLSASHKQVLLLHLQGYRKGEIARQIGMPIGTAMSRLFYARQKLQELCK